MPSPRIVKYRAKFCLYWRDEEGPHRRVLTDEFGRPCTTSEDAERASIDVQRLAIRPVGSLIGDLADKYFADKRGRLASYDNMFFAWKAIAPIVGHLRPDQITREWCREHAIRERKKGRADGTVRKQLTVLSAICRWSDKNSPAIIEMPPMPAARDRYLTREEFDVLLAGARAEHIRLFIILALQTAARAQALLDLKWSQVDFDRGLIDLGRSPTRFKKRATVPMREESRIELLKAKEGALTDYVIEHGGKRVKSVKKGFAAAASRAGIEDVSPHVLRHTAAIWMAEDGTSMSEIAQYLGHSTEAVTFRTYARYSPNHLRKAASALAIRVHGNTGALPMKTKK